MNSPLLHRARKAGERVLMYYMRNVQITDLPKTKSRDVRWIEETAREIMWLIKDSSDPMRDFHRWIERKGEDVERMVEHYIREVEYDVQKHYNKNGGI